MDSRNSTEFYMEYDEKNTTSPAANLLLTAAKSYLMYKIGEALDRFYFPIVIPVGIVGNVLSFLVMTQKHNRHMSFSLYISVLAVSDTVTLIVAFFWFLNQTLGIEMPPDQYWHCACVVTFSTMATMASTLFIIAMTFERFYSIIRPHKAASFNTVKRAKIIIICIIVYSTVSYIPHFFITTVSPAGTLCLSFGKIIDTWYGQFYYWFSFTTNFVIPFISLVFMNSFIIHTLRKRSNFGITKYEGQGQGQNQGQSQGHSAKTAERQIYVTLLLVTFSFLILTTPIYINVLYIMFYDFSKSPKAFAGYYLFSTVAPKLFYTNCGINFFLYVMSGHKFRSDLMNLFKFKHPPQPSGQGVKESSLATVEESFTTTK